MKKVFLSLSAETSDTVTWDGEMLIGRICRGLIKKKSVIIKGSKVTVLSLIGRGSREQADFNLACII